jgi:hypothetical protein
MRTGLVSIVPLIIFVELILHSPPNHYLNSLNLVKKDSNNYQVYKIDSINNYYIIYAKSGVKLFKIVSPKFKINQCNKIIVDNVYKFHLHSMLYVNGHSIIPANQKFEISGWRIDDSTTIDFEGDSIRDLYYADNVKGLCIIKKKTR